MQHSLDAAAYIDQAQALLGLSLDPAYRPGVIENMQVLAEVADGVMQFPLPDSVEPVPRFEPLPSSESESSV